MQEFELDLPDPREAAQESAAESSEEDVADNQENLSVLDDALAVPHIDSEEQMLEEGALGPTYASESVLQTGAALEAEGDSKPADSTEENIDEAPKMVR